MQWKVLIDLKVEVNQRKYPSGNVRLDAGEMWDAMETGRSVDGTAGAGSHGHGNAGGTVRVSDRRAVGHMFLQRDGPGGTSRS